MWADVFWPFAVVVFELVVFGITVYLARRFTRSHDAEWGTLESPPGAQVEAPAQTAQAPARAERETEPAAHGREPVGAA